MQRNARGFRRQRGLTAESLELIELIVLSSQQLAPSLEVMITPLLKTPRREARAGRMIASPLHSVILPTT